MKRYELKIGSKNRNEKNGSWKGNNVGYIALHDWVKRRLLKPKKCSLCRKKGFLDLANISGKYTRDLSDWEWLCRRCHMTKDGRINGSGGGCPKGYWESHKHPTKGKKETEEHKKKISVSLKKALKRLCCPKGHRFTRKNTGVSKIKGRNPTRYCKKCNRINVHNYKLKRRNLDLRKEV